MRRIDAAIHRAASLEPWFRYTDSRVIAGRGTRGSNTFRTGNESDAGRNGNGILVPHRSGNCDVGDVSRRRVFR